MKAITFVTIIFFGLIGCNKDKVKSPSDFTDRTGFIEIHRCYCSESAFRYLIVINEINGTKRYNPVNLPVDFKDSNSQIAFTANLLNDSSVVYTNTATDAVIEDFRVRNINLVKINKVNN
jgi:hypothetical protein